MTTTLDNPCLRGLPDDIKQALLAAPEIIIPESREQILQFAMDNQSEGVFEVAFEIPGRGRMVEATVSKCRNGLSVNYTEPYLRRRDPDCMVVGDNRPTNKPRYRERFGVEFDEVRKQTLDWLSQQSLIILPFMAGSFESTEGHGALLVAPTNVSFFVGGLGDLQGALTLEQLPENFQARFVLFLAPPFRHTHFEGKQVVVHNRTETLYEIFSYNLYPGPSAKKGVYGALLSLGVEEGWATLHGSCAQVLSPYGGHIAILHEGASGGGKSEMIEYAHREADGRLLLGRNVLTDERLHITLGRACQIRRVCDDMALCPSSAEGRVGGLVVEDAEEGWFVRLDHIKHYGTDPALESWTIHPADPLIFLNLDGVPGSTCLIWEHIEDAPGQPCPNPRVILPRRLVPDTVDSPVEVHYRNFGIRTPPCTKKKPTYGILGYLHILPPALAWIWRLVAPRGFANPSITDTAGLSSEGVGSYWPFASGRHVDHANLLLRQMQRTPLVRYTLTPNQHVGAFETSFMPQWIAREYLARRGLVAFDLAELLPSRCTLLGYALANMDLGETQIPGFLLRTEEQAEIGNEAYDAGASILYDFFKRELRKFLDPDLDIRGKRIIECCLEEGRLEDYEDLLRFD